MRVPTAPVVAGSLIGGYYVARTTRIRPLGGAVLALGGFVAEREWRRHAGPINAVILSSVYFGAFGVSHPLAKKIGPWPSVLTVAAVSAAAAWVLSDRRP
ncbi:MAG TPA: hypothetical protein VK549_04405 [Acidimicrobiia bacterium]|nr:hypothetical protein [Acidimicrobiia bacterium]